MICSDCKSELVYVGIYRVECIKCKSVRYVSIPDKTKPITVCPR